jgi:hypothetical protein
MRGLLHAGFLTDRGGTDPLPVDRGDAGALRARARRLGTRWPDDDPDPCYRMSGSAPLRRAHVAGGESPGPSESLEVLVQINLGIDVACRARHLASCADATGALLWSGHRFRTTAAELKRLWDRLPPGVDAVQVTVVIGTHPQRVGAVSSLVPRPRRPGW